jgi:hypothetical protein
MLKTAVGVVPLTGLQETCAVSPRGGVPPALVRVVDDGSLSETPDCWPVAVITAALASTRFVSFIVVPFFPD